MFRSKKGQVLDNLMKVIVAVALLLFVTFLVLDAREIVVDEKKTNTQLVLYTLMAKNCFSNSYGTFEERLVTQENADLCFPILGDEIVIYFLIDGKEIYVKEREDEFARLRNFCSVRSSNLCTQMSYPVTYIDNSGEISIEELTVRIIA